MDQKHSVSFRVLVIQYSKLARRVLIDKTVQKDDRSNRGGGGGNWRFKYDPGNGIVGEVYCSTASLYV